MRLLQRSALIAILASTCTLSFGQPATAEQPPRRAARTAAEITPELQARLAKAPKFTEMFIPMRDNVKLAANVFLPAGPGPFPVVLSRTPYIKDNPRAPLAAQKYVEAGYAFVNQDTRGKGHSEGVYTAFTTDIEDGYDTIEWIAKQPWSTGKIGITGGSALGITSNMAAMSGAPHLIAAYVNVAPYEQLRNTYPGGVLKDADTIGWLRNQGVDQTALNAVSANAMDSQAYAKNSVLTNQKYIHIPIWHNGAWYDIFDDGNRYFTYLQNQGSNGARGNQKLTMGAIGHGGFHGDLEYPQLSGLHQPTDEMRWWDYWLKGEDNGIMDEPPVTYFMMGAGRKGQPPSPFSRVVKAANWPPASRSTRYYLAPQFSLTTKPPVVADAKQSYRDDPAHPVKSVGGANLTQDAGPMDQRAIEHRPDYLRFESQTLTENVAVAGNIKMELFAATDGADTDFIVKLVDVYPDGYEAIILDGPIRARYRNGRLPDDVKMMTPNIPEKLTIDMWETAITFEKGHKIAVHIASTASTKFEVNPNTGEPFGQKPTMAPRIATNLIYFDKDHPSAMVLPVIYPELSTANTEARR
jgi:predicted acyl esterase